MNSGQLRALIGEINFQKLDQMPLSASRERHPTWCAIYYSGDGYQHGPTDRVQAAFDIENCVRRLGEYDPVWLAGIVPRLVGDDFSEATASLGEIKAYANLVGAYLYGVSSVPVSSVPTPDFTVRRGDDSVHIEVATKRVNGAMFERMVQENGVAAEKARKTFDAAKRNGEKGAVSTHAYMVEPFGLAKPGDPGDNSISNAISKLTAIKSGRNQFRQDGPVILWVDMGDPIFWPHDSVHANPYYVCAPPGYFCSGYYWYACYGRKGLPLFYNQQFAFPRPSQEMRHDGIFFGVGGDLISAVAFALPRCLIVFENFLAINRLPKWFRWSLPNIPDFNGGKSLLDWGGEGQLSGRIEAVFGEIRLLDAAFGDARAVGFSI